MAATLVAAVLLQQSKLHSQHLAPAAGLRLAAQGWQSRVKIMFETWQAEVAAAHAATQSRLELCQE